MALNSRADETVPIADSEELVRNSGLPSGALIEIGFEHRLADEESLVAMLRAVRVVWRPQSFGIADCGSPPLNLGPILSSFGCVL